MEPRRSYFQELSESEDDDQPGELTEHGFKKLAELRYLAKLLEERTKQEEQTVAMNKQILGDAYQTTEVERQKMYNQIVM
eukprot:CAMPEP_0168353988 /NCGR_PEP_ID=MMETSP0213-20121227/23603_1 /TAXON_ID=151035 /ORGANISM="Euplotes harpa, Strain FSP1.4" /LENGTH=79 /DNA_ID=CAMNT_0008365753 /DNA_START=53 /DNA_END=292 /DNA_ORIENTATION=-